MKIEFDTDHVVDSNVEVVPFAYSDLIKVDVPDTIAGLFPEDVDEVPVATVVTFTPAPAPAPAPALAPARESLPVFVPAVVTGTLSPKLDAQALARAVEVDQRRRRPLESFKKSKKVEHKWLHEHDYVAHAIVAIRYSVIALVSGVAAYGVYTVVNGIVSLASSMSTLVSHVPAVICGIIVLVLLVRFVNNLSIVKFVQQKAGKFNGTANLHHGLQPGMNTDVKTTIVAKKNKIGGIGQVSFVEQPVDMLAAQWVGKMRDRKTKQVVGGWQGETNNDRCAVGHLLDLDDPKGWTGGGNGFKHASFWKMKDRFGKKVLRNAIYMNDKGKSLPKIADYVEHELHKRGQL